MPKLAYSNKELGPDKIAVIREAHRLFELYADQGFVVTLRQIYYQFVAQDLFGEDRWFVNVGNNKWVRVERGTAGATKNAEPNYKWLGTVLADGRMCGYLDWDSMEDRMRNLEELAHWRDPAHIVKVVSEQFRTSKWDDQPNYVEAWIEKDALAGVIEPICNDLDVAFFCCRGYTSLSEMWSASQRLGKKIAAGKAVTLLHLGDHDPSGVDMSRDIEERLFLFIATDLLRAGEHGDGDAVVAYLQPRFRLDRIALNMDQIEMYDPPPNPAKIGDSRSRGYIKEYGNESWELDALEPTVLADLIEGAVLELRDEELWAAAVEREAAHRRTLEAASDRWPDVAKFLNGAAA